MKIGILYAIASAVLFGASTPFSKGLLGLSDPWLLAGLLYLGSGLGLGGVLLLRRWRGHAPLESPVGIRDLPVLAAATVAGGVIAPVALMLGLAQASASSAALLLNLEGLATMGLAWVVFRENVDRRLLIGAAMILAGAITLTWQGEAVSFGPGASLIALACLAWGVDNNVTRKVSGIDPVQITAIKGAVAGAVNLMLAVAQGAAPPSPSLIVGAGMVGFLGYGVSLIFFVLALRHLGAARTSAYFSVAPFVGAFLGIIALNDAVSPGLVVGGLLMAIGVWLHVTERHEHDHVHEALVHDHVHSHDDHHHHSHGADDLAGEPHAHEHAHVRMVHRHPHYPDLHHQHSH